MIPCVSLTETSVLGNMKERVKEMRVFGCRLNFWNNVTSNLSNKGKMFFRFLRLSLNKQRTWRKFQYNFAGTQYICYLVSWYWVWRSFKVWQAYQLTQIFEFRIKRYFLKPIFIGMSFSINKLRPLTTPLIQYWLCDNTWVHNTIKNNNANGN